MPCDSSQSMPLVIYDGACGICAGNLKWLHFFDWFKTFRAMPYQSDQVYRLCPQLKQADCEQALHLVLTDGRIFRGSDAFREVFLRMPLTMPAGIIMSIPPIPAVLRRLYPHLSKNRYKFGGHCKL